MKHYTKYILEKNKHSIIFDYVASDINIRIIILEYQVQIIFLNIGEIQIGAQIFTYLKHKRIN